MPLIIIHLVSLLSICLGAATVSLVFFSRHFSQDKGIFFFLFPLIPLGLFALSAHLDLVMISFNLSPLFFREFSRSVRLLIGLGWVLFCHFHYIANGVEDFRQRLTIPLVVLTVLNTVLYPVLVCTSYMSEGIYRFQILGMSITAFYAAVSAFLLLVKKNDILPSSWVGICLAGISLLVYPLAVISDVFGYRYPFFMPDRLVWEQLFPFYYLLVNVFIMNLFFSKKAFSSEREQDSLWSTLTRREYEIITLLAKGKSYKEISGELQLSLSTVKTHVANGYRKLKVKNRRELLRLGVVDGNENGG